MPRGGQGSKRGDVPTAIGALAPYIDSFDLVMRVEEKSDRTRSMYCDAVRWFAGWLTQQSVRRWPDVGVAELRAFFLHIKELDYSQSYRNNIGRCLQAFYKFLAAEEQLPNPFDQIKPPPPPKMGDTPPAIVESDALRALIKDAEQNRDFFSRRDAAMLRLFACTGCRLAEVTNLKLADVNVRERTAYVTGKGGKSRTVKFDHKCALALDRYIRLRAEHDLAQLPALWLGLNRQGPMTFWGVRRAVTRRAKALGMDIHPHLFRHTFTHNWLDAGGTEGDLMELNGWESPQMLRLYGRSARNARARRAYDRIDVMGGV